MQPVSFESIPIQSWTEVFGNWATSELQGKHFDRSTGRTDSTSEREGAWREDKATSATGPWGQYSVALKQWREMSFHSLHFKLFQSLHLQTRWERPEIDSNLFYKLTDLHADRQLPVWTAAFTTLCCMQLFRWKFALVKNFVQRLKWWKLTIVVNMRVMGLCGSRWNFGNNLFAIFIKDKGEDWSVINVFHRIVNIEK